MQSNLEHADVNSFTTRLFIIVALKGLFSHSLKETIAAQLITKSGLKGLIIFSTSSKLFSRSKKISGPLLEIPIVSIDKLLKNFL